MTDPDVQQQARNTFHRKLLSLEREIAQIRMGALHHQETAWKLIDELIREDDSRLLVARQQGRREGLEEAAKDVESHCRSGRCSAHGPMAKSIRALLAEPVAQPVDKDSRE